MPELPEVEVLVRHLEPLLLERTVLSVDVQHRKVVRPSTTRQLRRTLVGATFHKITRRGKFLVFHLISPQAAQPVQLLGHLGMTGRMYLLPSANPLPRHTTVSLDLGSCRFVFEDTRRFGRFTLDLAPLKALGPEPLSDDFTLRAFTAALQHSRQPVKIKLLDQSIVAGIGNIYASEALFLARIHPALPANVLVPRQVQALRTAIRRVLNTAIRLGGSLPLDWAGTGPNDKLFYYGRANTTTRRKERFRVYDRANRPCHRCRTAIRQLLLGSRSTYFCPHCQRQIAC